MTPRNVINVCYDCLCDAIRWHPAAQNLDAAVRWWMHRPTHRGSLRRIWGFPTSPARFALLTKVAPLLNRASNCRGMGGRGKSATIRERRRSILPWRPIDARPDTFPTTTIGGQDVCEQVAHEVPAVCERDRDAVFFENDEKRRPKRTARPRFVAAGVC